MAAADQHFDPSSRIYDKKAFAYDASKTALNAFTVHLAQEGELMHPGWIGNGLAVVQLATPPDNGTTGGSLLLGQQLPW